MPIKKYRIAVIIKTLTFFEMHYAAIFKNVFKLKTKQKNILLSQGLLNFLFFLPYTRSA